MIQKVRSKLCVPEASLNTHSIFTKTMMNITNVYANDHARIFWSLAALVEMFQMLCLYYAVKD